MKLTFAGPASLKADLDRHAALHAKTYGEAVDAVTLIRLMLEAFMAGDRGVKRGGTADPKPAKGRFPKEDCYACLPASS
jgi:hypothetical protein